MPAASDAGPTFVVRIHRYGGAPPSLNHTFEVAPDGSAHLTGHDALWCRGKTGAHAGAPVDTRVPLDPAVFAEVRELSIHPEVARFAGAQGPARAPRSRPRACRALRGCCGRMQLTGDCTGSPLRLEIDARAPGRIDEITSGVAKALMARFGDKPFENRMSALVVHAKA